MSYKSDKIKLPYPAQTVYDRLSDLDGLSSLIKSVPTDKIPEQQRQMLEQVQVTSDTISFPAGPVGNITLKVVQRQAPDYIRLEGVGTPVPMSMALNVVPLSADTCEAYVEIDVSVPAMLKPMVNKPLQQMADQFGHMLRQMPF